MQSRAGPRRPQQLSRSQGPEEKAERPRKEEALELRAVLPSPALQEGSWLHQFALDKQPVHNGWRGQQQWTFCTWPFLMPTRVQADGLIPATPMHDSCGHSEQCDVPSCCL